MLNNSQQGHVADVSLFAIKNVYLIGQFQPFRALFSIDFYIFIYSMSYNQLSY